MLYAVVFILVLWVGYITTALSSIQKQNKKILEILEEIRTKTINAEYTYK